ncbi:cupin domain-containing protein [Endozoicomonas numazuensis]|uniref:hypothetical protein n=1 Tax=Endozoicomonas numazuensis TaxID=1137799 RepID=UPI0012697343|nr:hypothetical protein [Endozoicomonas numazuensis]
MSEENIILPYWHLWADEEGLSHTSQRYLSHFDLIQYSNPTPEYHCCDLPKPLSTRFVVLPPGYEAPMHSTPKPQWVIILQGGWYTRTLDGNEVFYRAGDIHFGGDLPVEDKSENQQGHSCRNTSQTEPLAAMIIQVDNVLPKPKD